MTAVRYTEINCNGGDCFRAYNDVGGAAFVRRRAAQAGWTRTRDRRGDLCPEHRAAPPAPTSGKGETP